MTVRHVGRSAGLAGALVVLAAVSVACAGGEADPVDLTPPSTSAPSRSPEPAAPTFTPSLAPGTTLPTVGTPTVAVAELRDADDVDPDVAQAWTTYQEALAESLRAHRPTPELRAVAGPSIVQMVQKRGPADAEDGLTVSLRPLGRLESVDQVSGGTRLRTCLWAPTVGFFVEATGQEAEGGEPGWVEYRTVLERGRSGWVVTGDARSGRACPGEAP